MPAIVDTYAAFETHVNNKISGFTDKMGGYTEDMNTIVKLLQTLRDDHVAGAVDYATQPTKQALIDKLYEIAPHLLREDQAANGDRYRWSSEQCETLIDNLSHERERIHPLINQVMSQITQSYQERNQVTDIVGEILKEMREAVRAFLNKIGH